MSKAIYFDGPETFRRWLAGNHARAEELLVGFHKRDTGRPSLTWSESVDEALCYGWIDGIRRSVDEGRYTIRFTPRRPGSTWSAINVAKVKALLAAGRMTPAGVAAWEARSEARTAVALHEQRQAATFTPEQARALRADAKAWAHWEAQRPSYRKVATHWVTSAKKEETRASRFASLLACSAKGEPIPPMKYFSEGKAAGPGKQKRKGRAPSFEK